MKLKILPPTLRKNHRYLAIDIKSQNEISKDDLVMAVWDACIRFFGECESSNFNLWIVRFYEINDNNDYNHYKAILKCQRGFEDKIRSSLITLTKFKGSYISINTLGLSGTISGAVSKYID